MSRSRWLRLVSIFWYATAGGVMWYCDLSAWAIAGVIACVAAAAIIEDERKERTR